MTYLRLGAEVPLPPTCVYPGARLRVRGPARPLEGDYIAALGGSATFGKGVARPWPQLLEAETGRSVVNLGAIGAGPEAYLRDPALLAACGAAAAVVMQIPGVERFDNPFYRVHPRRNDRVIQVRDALRALYPEVDFHNIGFARALLDRLGRGDPDRFAQLAAGMQAVWAERMGALLDQLPAGVPVTLLWLGDRPPSEETTAPPVPSAPALVTRAMLRALRPRVADVVEAVAEPCRTAVLPALPSQSVHEATAAALATALVAGAAAATQAQRRAAV